MAAVLAVTLSVSACSPQGDISPQPAPSISSNDPADVAALAKALGDPLTLTTPFPSVGLMPEEPTLQEMSDVLKHIANDVLKIWRPYIDARGGQSRMWLTVLVSTTTSPRPATACPERNVVDRAGSSYVDPLKSGMFFCKADRYLDTYGVLYAPVDSIREHWLTSGLTVTARLAVLYAWFAVNMAEAFEYDIQRLAANKLRLTGLKDPWAENDAEQKFRLALYFGYCMSVPFFSFQKELSEEHMGSAISGMFGDPTGYLASQSDGLDRALSGVGTVDRESQLGAARSPGFCVTNQSAWRLE